MPIVSLLTVASPAGGASVGLNTNDQIWRWDSANAEWVKYYYRKIGTQAPVGWCKAGQTTVTTDTVPCGETVFFRRGTAGAVTTLTLSGQVHPFTAQTQYTVAPGNYCAIGYPWPVDLPIAGFEQYQGAPAGAASVGLNTNDQIWLWDSENNDWIKYYYRKIGQQAAVGWCKAGTTTVTTDVIPAGEGFYFRRGTAGAADTITFTYPNSTNN